MRRLPGAMRSGLTIWSGCVGPRLLYDAIESSSREAVPASFDAPTVMTQGLLPGLLMEPYCTPPSLLSATTRPRLPAAHTTTSPDFQAASAARHRGSVV